jgi:hypothetical protein
MKFPDRRCVTKIVHRKKKANPATAHFIEECFHLPDGSKFEIDQGGGVEKSLEQGTAPARAQPANAAFRRMARGENEWSAQLRDHALNLA